MPRSLLLLLINLIFFTSLGAEVRWRFDEGPTSDILWRHPSGANVLWFMNGDDFASVTLPHLDATAWNAVGAGDFDCDGIAEVVWRNKLTGANALWFIHGATVTTRELRPVIDLAWQVAAIADFDGDARSDILWRNVRSGTNRLWYMDGATVARSVDLPHGAKEWVVAGTGDFQGDGIADVLWRNVLTGRNRVWLMNAYRDAWSKELLEVTDTRWEVVGIGDFQNDGRADILWRGPGGANRLWLMNGADVTLRVTLPEMRGWKVASVGDFQGDGLADVWWRHPVTGANRVWFMDHERVADSIPISGFPDPEWQIQSDSNP